MSELHASATGVSESGRLDVADELTSAAAPTVRVRNSADPVVSIIVVTFGTGRVILDALAAVVDHTRIAAEVVVVDNPADGRPATGELLRAETAGVRLVTPGRNLGFGGGNELGVSLTTGEYVCFLNPDVVVADGWLEPLIRALADSTVAIAGPVLLNPDGDIQEAGRVIYRDGWTGAIAGRDMLTDDRGQLFSRDVDYVSAACWVVRRDEHVGRGGFDERYHPAFFEDVDYALRVESAGQRTRLVVDVPVVHEHGQGGAGRNAQPHQSHDLFCAAWSRQLADQPAPPESAAQARRARDRLAARRVAWVDCGGSARARRRGLGEAVDHAAANPRDRVVVFAARADGLDLDDARRAGVEVVVGDVDALLAERADELTWSRDIVSARSLPRHPAAVSWTALAGFVLVVGAVLRTIVLRSPAGEFNADEAYTGVQSFGILDGEFPVVIGGAAYTFPLESYLYAPFVALFGANILALKLTSTLSWVGAAVVVAVIGARLRRRRIGLVAVALLWISPGGMLLLSVTAYSAYSSGMLVSLVAFLLALRIVDGGDPPWWLAGGFGFAAGFGFWLHPMFVATLIPMTVIVLAVRRRVTTWAWVVGGGAAGCAPFLMWNAVNSFPSLDQPVDLEDTYGDRLRTFGVDLLPRALGLRDASLGWEVNGLVGPLLYAALLGLVAFGLVALVRQGVGPGRLLLPAVVMAAFPIMALFDNLIYAADGRYGVITFPFLMLAAAVGVDALMGHTTRRALAVAGAVAAVWLLGFVAPTLESPIDPGPNDPIAEVVERLDDAGIDRIAGSFWGVHPIEFAAGGDVYAAVTRGWPIRFPPRQRVVEASSPESVAFVFRLDNERPDQLWLPADAYRREEIGGYALYLPEPAVTSATD